MAEPVPIPQIVNFSAFLGKRQGVYRSVVWIFHARQRIHETARDKAPDSGVWTS
jgi:hypothetical protein